MNAFLTTVSTFLLKPFASSPLLALLLYSAVSGVLMTIIFRYTSNQKAIRAAADRTRAMMLRMRLFKDDFEVALQCQAELLKATGKRLLHSLPPMAVMIIPFFLVLTQLALWYEHRPLEAEEASVLELHVTPEAWPKWRGCRARDTPLGFEPRRRRFGTTGSTLFSGD